MIVDEQIRKAKKAFARQHGGAARALHVREFRADKGARCVRITHSGTGAWIEYNIAPGFRITKMAEGEQ